MKDVFIQNIMECISIGLIVINAEGEIITTNPAAEDILGFSGELLKAKGWAKFFFEMEGNTAFNQLIVDVIEHQKIRNRQSIPYIKPNGDQLYLTITCSFLRERDKPVGIVMLFNNDTEIHSLHMREKSILEERNRLQRERVESLKYFAMSVAHQIRNPLVSIGGFAQRILRETKPDDPHKASLEYILDGVRHLEDIVRTVEEYTAIASIEKTTVPASDLIDRVRSELDQKATELGKSITWNITVETETLHVEPFYFSGALIEILNNSLDSFKNNTGTISIHVRNADDTDVIELADTGTGIRQKDIRYVFDPFFTTKVKSIGIGLSKVRRIISEHRGTIGIKSRPGKGTTVIITIPYDN
ncbi:PAS domain S-box protein [bacterium]|nr:PAS domain S-box protein [bacterium]